jgi:hypothetical protein
VPEPLERGLPGGAENIANLPPAMTGHARLVDGLLHRLAGDGGQVPCRRQGGKRGAAADAGDRIGEPIHGVKVFMTISRCQFILDIRTIRGIPPAPRRTPACRVTVPPPPALSFSMG